MGKFHLKINKINMSNKELPYRIYVKYPSKIKKEEMSMNIYIKLTEKEKELIDKQQLQINSQQFLEWTEDTAVESYSVTFLIGNVIKRTKKQFDEKIIVKAKDENDWIILKKWMEQLLEQTEKHILSNQK